MCVCALIAYRVTLSGVQLEPAGPVDRHPVGGRHCSGRISHRQHHSDQPDHHSSHARSQNRTRYVELTKHLLSTWLNPIQYINFCLCRLHHSTLLWFHSFSRWNYAMCTFSINPVTDINWTAVRYVFMGPPCGSICQLL